MKKIASIGLLACMALGIAHVVAQDGKKKKTATPTTAKAATSTDDDAAQPASGKTTTSREYFLFPEFYSYWPIQKEDTTLKYECYDIHHNILNMDTLHSFDEVHYISLLETYHNYTHTYIDADGKPRPQAIASVVYLYERTGSDTWNSFDNKYKYSATLLDHKSNILRQDTSIVTNSVTGNKELIIRKYYRVEETGNNRTTSEDIHESNTANAKESTDTYLVPEFYFPKTRKNNDTTFEFFCYDSRDSIIHNLTNFDSVRYYSLYKSFTDPDHTYRDDDGKKKLLPVSSIVKRYDHLTSDKWMCVEYPGNKYTELREFKNAITASDTLVTVNPITGDETKSIYNYYKVIKQ